MATSLRGPEPPPLATITNPACLNKGSANQALPAPPVLCCWRHWKTDLRQLSWEF